MWGSQVPNKIRIHVWRAFHDAIPARIHLSRRGAWCLWQRRNRLIFENLKLASNEIVTWAGKLMGDFILCDGLDEPRVVKNRVPKLPWNPPTHGIIKINVDAAVNSSSDFIGVGAVARDEFGMVIAALSRRIFGKFSPHVGECLAVREGLCLAHLCGFQNFMVESDALNAVGAIQRPLCRALESNVVADIREMLASNNGT
ncbi:hypothetical protein TIFTF001_035828 [Ficus carica]|uniref:RNase H type-1 domain-containing protein n=1 Tax=Ficus carica TaxID=3494 RepID=A0AA88E286_FICCA|nr:hypothetical protein TIFTF001_035828 [Ficus carica]